MPEFDSVGGIARTALQVQNASNLSGVIHSWSQAVTALRKFLPDLGTEQINRHPVNVLFASKAAELSGACGLADQFTYNAAYTGCQELAKQFDPVPVARQIHGWLQEAIGDMADVAAQEDEWKAKIRKAKKAGVTDVKGWLADELYNDPDTLSDLVGDKVYDAGKTVEQRVAILDELARTGHAALKQVCLKMKQEALAEVK